MSIEVTTPRLAFRGKVIEDMSRAELIRTVHELALTVRTMKEVVDHRHPIGSIESIIEAFFGKKS